MAMIVKEAREFRQSNRKNPEQADMKAVPYNFIGNIMSDKVSGHLILNRLYTIKLFLEFFFKKLRPKYLSSLEKLKEIYKKKSRCIMLRTCQTVKSGRRLHPAFSSWAGLSESAPAVDG